MLLQNKSVKRRWRRRMALLILNKKKEKKEINVSQKEQNPCRNIKTETFNKIKNQQILCHDKMVIWTSFSNGLSRKSFSKSMMCEITLTGERTGILIFTEPFDTK